MGKSLGCGAHLKSLRRIACGHLTIDQAVTLDELERLDPTMAAPLLSLEKPWIIFAPLPGKPNCCLDFDLGSKKS